jgi:hypothetical protein
MAINRRALMGESGQRPGTISARGVRSITTKDSISLVKSLKSINTNLVAINKLLQQQSKLDTKEQSEQQRKKRLDAQNLRREEAEKRYEGFGRASKGVLGFANTLLKGVGSAIGSLKDTLVKGSKGILGKLIDVAKPFVTFFTLGFIGWFSGPVVKWFKQNKEVKKKQIKSYLPKILSAIAVAGGVLLAVQVGIPVIMGLIGSIVAMVPLLIGALFNPLTWKTLAVGGLVAGTAILGGELTTWFQRTFSQGTVERRRLEGSGTEKLLTNYRQYIKKGEFESDSKERESAVGANKDKFITIGGKTYSTRQLSGLIGDYTGEGGRGINDPNFIFKLAEYTKKEDKAGEYFLRTGEADVTGEKLRKGEALPGLPDAVRASLANAMDFRSLTKRYQYFYKTLKDEQDKLRIYNQARQGQRVNEIESAEGLLKTATNDRKYAQRILEEELAKTTDNVRTQFTNMGVNLADLQKIPDPLKEGETAFQLRKAATEITKNLQNMVNPFLEEATKFAGQMDKALDGILDAGLSVLDVNLNVTQTIPNMLDGDPESIPIPANIAPYDTENPWLRFASKVYSVSAVGS